MALPVLTVLRVRLVSPVLLDRLVHAVRQVSEVQLVHVVLQVRLVLPVLLDRQVPEEPQVSEVQLDRSV